MVLMELATKEQLLQIALYENCDLSLKYAAARELQERFIPEEIRADILFRLGVGTEIKQVAKENGLTILQVQDLIRSYHQKHKSSENWMVGYKLTLKNCGRRVY